MRRLAPSLALLLALALPGSLDAAAAGRPLGRGVNVLSTDGMFTPGGGSRFSFATFARLKALGFDHVRVNTRPFETLGPDGRPTERWIGVLRGVVDAALAAGLDVVVDVHEFIFCQRDAATCERRLTSTWETLAARLSDYDDRVVFEILNEPGGAMDDATWNRVLAAELAVVRRLNPTRRVIVGPGGGNHPSRLESLRLPEADRNILVGVHYYEPFGFTHQGATWARLDKAVGIDWGSAADQARLRADFDGIAEWARRQGREIYLGEFGVYDRADPRPRFCWLHRVARAAEARGWAWAYWQLTSDFTLMDETTGRWNDWVVAALMSPADPALCAPPVPTPLRTVP